MEITVKTEKGSYPVICENGALRRAGEMLARYPRVLIVTDSGVPAEYVRTVASTCREYVISRFKAGENSKAFRTYSRIISSLLKHKFDRCDCIAAVGGGVCGDLAGFAAATYMRGIDYYNFPTTLLSQTDSSVGGKTAINYAGIKNSVGVFWAPRGVVIDPDTLSTLPKRQVRAGMAEIIKMAATCDEDFFSDLEKADPRVLPDADLISRSVNIKKSVVERDERESGPRRVLNFGHTVGHAVESAAKGRLLHGECVGIGMAVTSSPEARKRLLPLLERFGIPTKIPGGLAGSVTVGALAEAMEHDKKRTGDNVVAVLLDEIGKYEFRTMNTDELLRMTKDSGILG